MTARASEQALVARVGADVLAGRWGSVVRQAAADRAAIVLNLSTVGPEVQSRPELLAAVDELLARVTDLAPTLHQLDAALDPEMIAGIDRRLEASRREPDDAGQARLTAMLERQRASLTELEERRARLVKQIDSASLAIARVRYETRRVRDRKPPA